MHDDTILQLVAAELELHKQLIVRYRPGAVFPFIVVRRPNRAGTIYIIRAGKDLLLTLVSGHYRIDLKSIDLTHPDHTTHLWDIIRFNLKKRYSICENH